MAGGWADSYFCLRLVLSHTFLVHSLFPELLYLFLPPPPSNIVNGLLCASLFTSRPHLDSIFYVALDFPKLST